MRTFELRVYTLRTQEALDFYVEQIYPRHLSSFPVFGIEAHGLWTAKEDAEPRLFVLASYAAGEEPREVARRYMQSTAFAEDVRTLMSHRSLAFNRRSSSLQLALLLFEVTQPHVLFLEEVKMEVLNVVAIIVVGLMVGCELAVAAFIHPTLDKLSDDAHLPAASAIARVLGTVMPFWYNLRFFLR